MRHGWRHCSHRVHDVYNKSSVMLIGPLLKTLYFRYICWQQMPWFGQNFGPTKTGLDNKRVALLHGTFFFSGHHCINYYVCQVNGNEPVRGNVKYKKTAHPKDINSYCLNDVNRFLTAVLHPGEKSSFRSVAWVRGRSFPTYGGFHVGPSTGGYCNLKRPVC